MISQPEHAAVDCKITVLTGESLRGGIGLKQVRE
jgi:hypothetical protein